MARRSPQHAAFTLVEILIVVVILGVLAAIVVTGYGDITTDTRKSTFVTNLKSYADAAAIYTTRTGEYVEDTSSGVCPADFDDLIDCNEFERPTPIGGVWDFEYLDNGVTSAVGVHFDGSGDTQDDDYMATIDDLLDDGDLATGAFRKLADNRFYYIIEQ